MVSGAGFREDDFDEIIDAISDSGLPLIVGLNDARNGFRIRDVSGGSGDDTLIDGNENSGSTEIQESKVNSSDAASASARSSNAKPRSRVACATPAAHRWHEDDFVVGIKFAAVC